MANYKIIGGDRKEYGPETPEQVRQWIAEGRANAQTLAQAEGSGVWKQLGDIPEFQPLLRPPAPGVVAPLRSAPPLDAGPWTAQILAREPEINIGRCLARSWSLLTANFSVLFGAAFLVWMVTVLCQMVPVLGGLAAWILAGVFNGGLCLVFLRRIRGQQATVGDAFSGFSRGVAQLILAGFVSSLLGWIGLLFCVVPGLYLLIAWVFSVPLVADRGLEFWSAMELSRKIVTRVWFKMFGLFILAFLPFTLAYAILETRITLSMIQAVQDATSSGSLDFGRISQAMLEVAKGNFVLVALVKVALLVNLPFAVGALMHAYEDLFGARTTPAA